VRSVSRPRRPIAKAVVVRIQEPSSHRARTVQPESKPDLPLAHKRSSSGSGLLVVGVRSRKGIAGDFPDACFVAIEDEQFLLTAIRMCSGKSPALAHLLNFINFECEGETQSLELLFIRSAHGLMAYGCRLPRNENDGFVCECAHQGIDISGAERLLIDHYGRADIGVRVGSYGNPDRVNPDGCQDNCQSDMVLRFHIYPLTILFAHCESFFFPGGSSKDAPPFFSTSLVLDRCGRALTDQVVNTDRTASSKGEVEEDEAIHDRQQAAVQDREEAVGRENHEIGNGHFT